MDGGSGTPQLFPVSVPAWCLRVTRDFEALCLSLSSPRAGLAVLGGQQVLGVCRRSVTYIMEWDEAGGG